MTSRNKPVVVGVDGSATALLAVRWAAGRAARDGLPLRIVHAYQLPVGFPSGVTEEESILTVLRGQGRRWLEEARVLADATVAGLDVHTELAAMATTAGLSNSMCKSKASPEKNCVSSNPLLIPRGLATGIFISVGEKSGLVRCPWLQGVYKRHCFGHLQAIKGAKYYLANTYSRPGGLAETYFGGGSKNGNFLLKTSPTFGKGAPSVEFWGNGH